MPNSSGGPEAIGQRFGAMRARMRRSQLLAEGVFREMAIALAVLARAADGRWALVALNPAGARLFGLDPMCDAASAAASVLPWFAGVEAQLDTVAATGVPVSATLSSAHGGRRISAAICCPERGMLAVTLSETVPESVFDSALAQPLIDALPGIFFVFSYPELRLVRWNGQHEAALGLSAEEMAGRPLSAWFAPGERGVVFETVEHLMHVGALSRDADIVAPGGGRIPLALRVVRFEEAGCRYLMGLGFDIADQRRRQREFAEYRRRLAGLVVSRTEELARAKESAEAASLAKSNFLSSMSHEIRTPMNAVLGMANLLRRTGLTPVQAEYLRKIDTSATYLLEIINDVLDLSKVEAGKFVLEDKPVSLAGLLANVRSIVSERASAKNLRVMTTIDVFPPGLHGDPTRLQQALLNYATNAVKFTESGSIELRATLLEEDEVGALVRLEVEDTGVGIESALQPRLFQPFEQADASTARRFGGTGLGLSITRHLAELMGGHVGVDSSVGRGSLFWLTARLRKRQALGEYCSVGTPAEPERALRELHRGRRILLADDDPVSLEIARFLLEDAGLVVDVASDGEEAVRLAAAGAYVLILMDVQMPLLDGLDATRRIRALDRHRTTPVLALTANVFAEDRARCAAAGMNDFIGKPFEFPLLLSTVLKWLA